MTKKLLAFLLSLIFIFSLAACGDKDDNTSSDEAVDNPVSRIPYSSEEVSSEEVYKPDLDSWEMMLVNKWSPLPDGYDPELAYVKSEYSRGGRTDYRFDARAVDALHDLCKASKKDGVNLFIISPYRTNATQESLFNRELNEVKAQYPNMTDAEARAKAATEVAAPGTSEHQSGLAVDFNSVEQSFDKTKEYKWLSENAHLYGFIMRYPKSKEDKTAVIYEPWHYRYVGIENAMAIKESGLCLEEFIEQYKKPSP
ncbi:MAG: M15 family metallopeptidase [Clostridia bacterium]|nr:M15 family metallopeptidase [Clostridia bacterium]